MRKIAIVALMLMILSLNVFALKVSVQSYDPLPAKAGEFADVFITIENNSRADTEPVKISLVPKDSIRLSYGENADKDIGIIPGNKAVTVKYKVQIVQDAIEGENEFDVVAKEGKLPTQTFTLSINVDNEVPNIEIGDIESEPKKVLPDTDDVKLTIKLLNIGNASAENLKATLKLPEGLEVSDSFSDIALIGNLAADSSEDTTYFIDVPADAKAGAYKANMIVEYTREGSEDNSFLTKSIPFDIIVGAVPKFEITSIETDPQELSAGQRNVKMKVRIKNVGEADADVVRFKVFEKTEQPFEFDLQSAYIAPKLEPGEEGEATLIFRVKEDANPQKYLLQAEVKSFIEDSVRLEEEVITLNVVKGKAESPDLLIVFAGAIVVLLGIAIFYFRGLGKAKANKKA